MCAECSRPIPRKHYYTRRICFLLRLFDALRPSRERRSTSVPRATIHVRCRHGPARAVHAAPLHRVHPWGVGDPSLASQPMQRAHSGDAGGLRRDIAAAAHTQKSSGSPGPPCSRDWSMIYFPVASGKTPSRPILTAGAPGSSPSDQTGAVKGPMVNFRAPQRSESARMVSHHSPLGSRS